MDGWMDSLHFTPALYAARAVDLSQAIFTSGYGSTSYEISINAWKVIRKSICSAAI